jgi:hypothetical protein
MFKIIGERAECKDYEGQDTAVWWQAVFKGYSHMYSTAYSFFL